MRYIILFLCISAGNLVYAQKNVRYIGTAEGGLLTGSKGLSTFIFTTQGIQFDGYSFGVGSGIDFYGFSSMPLFVDVKRKFTSKNTQPFIEAGAGINFTNSNSSAAKDQYNYAYGSGKFDNSFFARGGGGILFRAKKKINFSLSAGYQYKTASYTYTPFINPFVGQTQPIKDIYHFNRWYVGAGIVW
jgi:hypothetical protein